MIETAPSDTKVATELGVDAVVSHASTPPAGILIGYARCSTEKQDLSAQREILRATQRTVLLKLHGAGEHSPFELAELFSISRATVYRESVRTHAKKPVAGVR